MDFDEAMKTHGKGTDERIDGLVALVAELMQRVALLERDMVETNPGGAVAARHIPEAP